MLFLNFREQGFINKNPLRIIITALPYSGDEFLINQFKMIPGVYYQPFPFGKFKFHPISRPDIEDATEAAEYLLGTIHKLRHQKSRHNPNLEVMTS